MTVLSKWFISSLHVTLTKAIHFNIFKLENRACEDVLRCVGLSKTVKLHGTLYFCQLGGVSNFCLPCHIQFNWPRLKVYCCSDES